MEIVTSPYAAAQALYNIDAKEPKQLSFLLDVLESMRIADESMQPLPFGIMLPADDRPILQSAIGCGATHLLTGDKDFRGLFGRVVENVLIMRPGDYLQSRGR